MAPVIPAKSSAELRIFFSTLTFPAFQRAPEWVIIFVHVL